MSQTKFFTYPVPEQALALPRVEQIMYILNDYATTALDYNTPNPEQPDPEVQALWDTMAELQCHIDTLAARLVIKS